MQAFAHAGKQGEQFVLREFGPDFSCFAKWRVVVVGCVDDGRSKMAPIRTAISLVLLIKSPYLQSPTNIKHTMYKFSSVAFCAISPL